MGEGLVREAHGPLVSIITVVMNGVAHIRQTLDSVAVQSYPHLEHIVIDGGSTDGTLDVLRRACAGRFSWLSEPDDGIADAMNKGIERARGKWLLFLHADDYLLDAQVLERAMTRIDDDSCIWAFDIYQEGPAGCRRCRPRPFNAWVYVKNPLPHQGVFCPRWLFDQVGRFDTRLHIDMDYDLWLRAFRQGLRWQRVPQVLAVMRDNGVSSRRDWPSLAQRFSEEHAIHLRHASSRGRRWLYYCYWPLYLGYRRLRCLAGG